MPRLRFSGLLIIARIVGASPASAEVTYTFTGNFQNGNFAPPNVSFSITLPSFVTFRSDLHGSAKQPLVRRQFCAMHRS